VIPGQPLNRQDLFMTANYFMFNLQDWNSAEGILRRLIQADRNDFQAYSEMLRLYSLSGQHEKSVSLLEEYLTVHPGDTSASGELKRIKASLAPAGGAAKVR
jgi:tetratricopeptide (TPR) repeat protein